MKLPTIVFITGHPGTGKTTPAEALRQELNLPLTGRDQFKETLLDTLGWSGESPGYRQLGTPLPTDRTPAFR